MIIDTHSHLYEDAFSQDIENVIQRAIDSGIESIIVPGTTLETSRTSVELAELFPIIYAAVGFHPHNASEATEASLGEIEKLCAHPKVVAIGEIGLDYYYNFSPRETQKEVFIRQIEIAIKKELPLIIHTRDSIRDAIDVVRTTMKNHNVRQDGRKSLHESLIKPFGVFHCFSGSAEEAFELMHMGFFVSFPGTVTFKKNSPLEVVKKIGYDHILVETDSPYLSPEPNRGKRNEPAYIRFTTRKIAEVFDVLEEDIARTTRYNAKKVFRIGNPEPSAIVYKMRHSLYVNLTNRCSAECVFCCRKSEAVVKGYNLKLEQEPTVEEVINAIGDPKMYDEIVFCGYGEPTIRLDELKAIAIWVKENGGRVRINTNGHGNIINRRNIVPELKSLIDAVSISLNTINPMEYGEIMNIDGDRFFNSMLEFTKECKNNIPEVVMTVVDYSDIDVNRAKEFVENEVGVKFRIRPYF